MVSSFLAATRTGAGPMPPVSLKSLPGLCPLIIFKLWILPSFSLFWINLCLPVLCQHRLTVKGRLAQCSLLSLWVHGCWVSTSSNTQAKQGHNASDRGVPKDCSCRIGVSLSSIAYIRFMLQGLRVITVTVASADHAVHGVPNPYPKLYSIQTFIRMNQDKNGCHYS